ncbi:MAG TPA: hypothetical protein VFR09_07845, partial [Alphaproteobacteria bacterium]|nr:hypothetical protein [Alphaproteobacteria bacterium]
MPAIEKHDFPCRLPMHKLRAAYASVEDAFDAHDYLYVARFVGDDPELRGCALLLLGNRVGGERILDQNKIETARSYYYRFYAAWCDDDLSLAQEYLNHARRRGGDTEKLDRLEHLINKKSFRVLLHWDFHNSTVWKPFKELPGVEAVVSRYMSSDDVIMVPVGQPVSSAISGPFDLIILDDVKMVPLGLKEFRAPVIAI